MKQVTMESVKQRISKLASRGNAEYALGLTLNEEFELSCLRELVAVTEQRDALVAENAVLKSAFNPVDIPEDAVEAFTETAIMDHDWDDTGTWSWVENDTDVIRAVLEALKPETPATDAAIAALREEATEAAFNSDKHAALCDSAYVSGMHAGWNFGVDEDVTGFQQSLEAYRKPMREARRQLRESKGEVQS